MKKNKIFSIFPLIYAFFLLILLFFQFGLSDLPWRSSSVPNEYIVLFREYMWEEEIEAFFEQEISSFTTQVEVIRRNNPATKLYPTDFALIRLENTRNSTILQSLSLNSKIKRIMEQQMIQQQMARKPMSVRCNNDENRSKHGRSTTNWFPYPFQFTKADNSTNDNMKSLQTRKLLSSAQETSQISKSVAQQLNADLFWEHGFEGEDVHVAVFDTGLSSKHPAFQSGKIQEIINFSSENTPDDLLGHGSFISGLIGAARDDSKTKKPCQGLAPRATLHIFKVFTSEQISFTSWFLDAFNYALKPQRRTKNQLSGQINLINLSIGGQDTMDYPFIEKVREISSSGILVISAIGNDGPSWGSIANPGDQLDVLGVGGLAEIPNLPPKANSLYDLKENFRKSHLSLASFSSRGASNRELNLHKSPSFEKHKIFGGYGRAKPDLVTLSSRISGITKPFKINALRNMKSLFSHNENKNNEEKHLNLSNSGSDSKDLDENWGYGCQELSGTSMACPIVTAAVALMSSTIPDHEMRRKLLNPASIKQILMEGCDLLDNYSFFEQGAGALNILKSTWILHTKYLKGKFLKMDDSQKTKNLRNLLLSIQKKLDLPDYNEFEKNSNTSTKLQNLVENMNPSFFPSYLDTTRGNSHFSPLSLQPIFFTSAPLIFNFTIINPLSPHSYIIEDSIKWVPKKNENGRNQSQNEKKESSVGIRGQPDNKDENHKQKIEQIHKFLKVSFDFPSYDEKASKKDAEKGGIWPWNGHLAAFFQVTEKGKLFEGEIEGEIVIKIVSKAVSSEDFIPYERISEIRAPVKIAVTQTPIRSKRILWDQFHSLQYPEAGYVPKDNLNVYKIESTHSSSLFNLETTKSNLEKGIPNLQISFNPNFAENSKSDDYMLDWNADHLHTNYLPLFKYLRSQGFFIDILHSDFTTFDAKNYAVLMIVDPEDEFSAAEREKIHNDVIEKGLSLIVLANWYNSDVMENHLSFFDENSKKFWKPTTGGSNLPSLNAFLEPFEISFGDAIFSGVLNFPIWKKIKKTPKKLLEKEENKQNKKKTVRSVPFLSGSSIIRFPRKGILLLFNLLDETKQILLKFRSLTGEIVEKVPIMGFYQPEHQKNPSKKPGRVVVMGDSSFIDAAQSKHFFSYSLDDNHYSGNSNSEQFQRREQEQEEFLRLGSGFWILEEMLLYAIFDVFSPKLKNFPDLLTNQDKNSMFLEDRNFIRVPQRSLQQYDSNFFPFSKASIPKNELIFMKNSCPALNYNATNTPTRYPRYPYSNIPHDSPLFIIPKLRAKAMDWKTMTFGDFVAYICVVTLFLLVTVGTFACLVVGVVRRGIFQTKKRTAVRIRAYSPTNSSIREVLYSLGTATSSSSSSSSSSSNAAGSMSKRNSTKFAFTSDA